jgi:hypothetical protein
MHEQQQQMPAARWASRMRAEALLQRLHKVMPGASMHVVRTAADKGAPIQSILTSDGMHSVFHVITRTSHWHSIGQGDWLGVNTRSPIASRQRCHNPVSVQACSRIHFVLHIAGSLWEGAKRCSLLSRMGHMQLSLSMHGAWRHGCMVHTARHVQRKPCMTIQAARHVSLTKIREKLPPKERRKAKFQDEPRVIRVSLHGACMDVVHCMMLLACVHCMCTCQLQFDGRAAICLFACSCRLCLVHRSSLGAC